MFDIGAAGGVDLSQPAPRYQREMSTTIALAVPRGPSVQSSVTEMWWGGPAQNGWGMSVTRHGDVLVSVLYIYDAAGDPRWVIMPGGQWNAQKTVYTGNLYRPRGAPYSRPLSGTSFEAGAPVGTATLTLGTADRMVLDTTLDGVRQSRDLQRQVFGAPSAMLNPPVADQWWGGVEENGWGVAIAQQQRNLFAVWFTYDASGAPTWLVAPSGIPHHDLPTTAETKLYLTHGSPWNGAPYDPARLTVQEVGSLILYLYSTSHGNLRGHSDVANINTSIYRMPF
jgi:hypothetical protein